MKPSSIGLISGGLIIGAGTLIFILGTIAFIISLIFCFKENDKD